MTGAEGEPALRRDRALEDLGRGSAEQVRHRGLHPDRGDPLRPEEARARRPGRDAEVSPMEKLIERIVKAPLGAKIGVVAGIIAAITVLNYFVLGMHFGTRSRRPRTRSGATEQQQATARQGVHREDRHREQPEPVPAREGAARAAAPRGARRAPRGQEDRGPPAALPGPRDQGRAQDRQHRAEAAGDRAVLREDPDPDDGDRQLPRDRDVLRLARPHAPHRERRARSRSTRRRT